VPLQPIVALVEARKRPPPRPGPLAKRLGRAEGWRLSSQHVPDCHPASSPHAVDEAFREFSGGCEELSRTCSKFVKGLGQLGAVGASQRRSWWLGRSSTQQKRRQGTSRLAQRPPTGTLAGSLAFKHTLHPPSTPTAQPGPRCQPRALIQAAKLHNPTQKFPKTDPKRRC
jgi:hypothetical protein